MRSSPRSPHRSSLLLGVCATLVAAALFTGCERSAATKPAVPRTGAYFGSWIKPQGVDTKANVIATFAMREAEMGRRYDIGHSFYTFGTAFPTWREQYHLDQGRIPLISWNGTTTTETASGRHDALITARAQGVKALKAPVFLRFDWEPEARKNDAATVSPASYIAAWRRVHKIFTAAGTSNAAFVWCPTAYGFRSGEAQQYYPGDAYVDWICADGYNWGDSKTPATWADWNTLYKAFYAFGSAHNKPMMAGEWATVENPGTKAQFYASARAQLKAMPRIKAIVHFDTVRYADGVWHDWRPDTSTTAYTAFKAMARDPYFNPAR